jgi:hypothetical protein
MDQNGNISVDHHLQWLARERQVQEASSSSSSNSRWNRRGRHPVSSAMVPRRFDVLFGRGPTTSEHTGNRRALLIVEMHRPLYERAGKFQKTQIAARIVHLIHQSHGRFLKKEENNECYYEVDDEMAREKVSHFFRRLREIHCAHIQIDNKAIMTHSNNKATKRTRHAICDPSPLPAIAAAVEADSALEHIAHPNLVLGERSTLGELSS